jgi:3-methyladenine DNA glycosylase AlkD
MTLDETMSKLKELGSEQSKKVLMKHGALDPFYGVKVEDMKKEIVEKVKKDYDLSLQLYATGNSDAMYLAGLISDPPKMTKADLQQWVKNAYWYMLSEYTVAWVAAESNFGWELGLEWIESGEETIAACGWNTLSSLATLKPDEALDIKYYEKLLDRVENEIHSSKNRVRYTMNGFVITIGSRIHTLNIKAKEIAQRIGKVQVEMDGTACKVPYAPDYFKKVEDRGKIGAKKKRVVC